MKNKTDNDTHTQKKTAKQAKPIKKGRDFQMATHKRV